MMEEFVRLENVESLSRIRAVAADVWPKTFREILSEEQIGYMMKMMYSPEVMEKEFSSGYCFDMLVIDGKDAGYMVYSPCADQPRMKLHKLYLLEEYQGKGYGQKMLQHVKESALKSGYTVLVLAVNKQNIKAQRAYLRAGFELEYALKTDIGSGFYMDDYHLICKLA
jgi:GNAT superfamily N-acetyltransferase